METPGPTTPSQRRLNKRRLFETIHYAPHPGQLLVHRSSAPRRVVACGVRWGKTVCAANEAIAAAMEPRDRSIGWVVAPTYDLAERVFSRVVITVATHLNHRIISLKEHERRLVVRNLGGGVSEIRAKTADNPVSLLGEGLDYLIIDEASRLKPAIWENYLSQRLIDRHGWALAISTPRGKSWFYEMWKRGQGLDADYESWNAPSWMSPLLDGATIEAERSRLPEQTFRQEYGAEFLEGSGAVFRNVRECATGTFKEPEKGVCYFGGLDLAKSEDFTVLVIMTRQREVVFVDRFHRLDWGLQIERVKAAAKRYNHAQLLIDSTGAGEPVYEALRREGVNVEGYTFGTKSKNDLITHLSMCLERNEIVLPRADLWPVGIMELEDFEYSVNESGNVKTGAPGSGHDDCAIAVALAAMHARNNAFAPQIYLISRRGRLTPLSAVQRWRMQNRRGW